MIKDLEKKSEGELKSLYEESVISLRNFRFGIAHSKSRDLKEGKNLKKDIARILTLLKSK